MATSIEPDSAPPPPALSVENDLVCATPPKSKRQSLVSAAVSKRLTTIVGCAKAVAPTTSVTIANAHDVNAARVMCRISPSPLLRCLSPERERPLYRSAYDMNTSSRIAQQPSRILQRRGHL